MLDIPFKFLGSEITEENSSTEMFESIKAKLKDKLIIVNNSRGENRIRIYSRYTFPLMRFYFLVHQIDKISHGKVEQSCQKTLNTVVKH